MINKKASFGAWMFGIVVIIVSTAFIDEIFLDHIIRTTLRGFF